MQFLIIIIISLLIFSILIWALTITCPIDKNIKEPWVNYQELPYGNITTGAGNPGIRPLSLYEYKTYRRPLNYPICHLVDYPIPHCITDSF